MANTNEPYRRIGSNSWEELLDQVNDKLQNPEPGCDPIDPIQIPEAPHKWSKEDIQEVHDKLNEMPTDCFTFEPIPDKWKISIIEDIENQLENAWCDCVGGCYRPCENARTPIGETIHNGSDSFGDGDCTDCSNTSEQQQDAINTINSEWQPLITQMGEQRDLWADAFVEACDLQEEVDDLQDEVDRLQEQVDDACGSDPPASNCSSLQQELSDKENELAEKQTELAEAEGVRDANENWDSLGVQANSIRLPLTCEECAEPLFNFTAQNESEPMTNLCCGDGSEATPCAGPNCPEGTSVGDVGGFFRAGDRCLVRWGVQTKFTYYLGNCFSGPTGPYGGVWQTRLGGIFGKDGTPILTSARTGCMPVRLNATCYSSCCGCNGGPCQDGSPCAPGSQSEMEYRTLLSFPRDFDPVNCNGGQCEEEEPPAP